MEARALLDNASSASFVSEHLAQILQLPCSPQSIHVCGIAGSSPSNTIQSVASLQITSLYGSSREINLTAIVLQKITCDHLSHPYHLTHLGVTFQTWFWRTQHLDCLVE